MALLFSGVEPYMQFWKGASWGTFMCSYLKFGPVVLEMLFKAKVCGKAGPRRKTDHNSSPSAFGSGELKYSAQCNLFQNDHIKKVWS